MKVTRQTQSPSKLANRLVRRGPMPMALEQRFMFDGAAVAEVTHDISAESTATKDTSSIELTAVATAKDVGSAVTPAADTDSVQGAVPGLNTPYQSQELSPVPAHMSLLSTDKSNEVSAILQSGFDKTQQVVLDFVARSNTNTLFSLFNGGRAQADSAWLNTASTLQQDILNGNYQVRVELVSNTDMGGAFGVFAAKGTDGKPTIFINREWASAQTDTGSLTRVLVEEVGHSIDAALNPDRDTAGDEGEAFAAQAMNVTLNAADTLRIANENDHSTIRINAVTYEVEQASVTFTNVYSGTPECMERRSATNREYSSTGGHEFSFRIVQSRRRIFLRKQRNGVSGLQRCGRRRAKYLWCAKPSVQNQWRHRGILFLCPRRRWCDWQSRCRRNSLCAGCRRHEICGGKQLWH